MTHGGPRTLHETLPFSTMAGQHDAAPPGRAWQAALGWAQTPHEAAQHAYGGRPSLSSIPVEQVGSGGGGPWNGHGLPSHSAVCAASVALKPGP